MIDRFERIKNHFEKEASVFDALFFKVMPEYEEMMGLLTGSLPFTRRAKLDIVDLGCGTGNLTLKILAAFPHARVACVDMAENMLAMAKTKLKFRRVTFWQGDVRRFAFGRRDAIVSSMVLHHIEQRDKAAFYRKLFASLKPGGAFFNIDIFVSPDRHLQGLFMDKWKEHMRSHGLPQHKVLEMLRRHRQEDRPACLADELAILSRAGFRPEVVAKRYNFAVYGGTKP
jgi:tRNA (cmo5U34)-methyltransferase